VAVRRWAVQEKSAARGKETEVPAGIVAVIFDADGTLIDSKEDIAVAANYAMKVMGRPPLPHEQIYRYVGHGGLALVASALRGGEPVTHPDPELAQAAEEALKHFIAYYNEHPVDHTRLFPGVAEVLAELSRRGKQLAVATNKDAAVTRLVLQKLAAESYFPIILGHGNAPRLKPDPAIIHEILQAYGVPPAAAVMVGDSEVDVQTGHNARIATIGLTYGHGGRAALERAGADWVVDDVRDRMALLP